jgi:hypothetical protein
VACTFTLQAQTWGNNEYWISYEYTPNKGEKVAFEKAISNKTKKWNKTVESAIYTFEIVNGPNSGTYERWIVRKDRSFFDQDFSGETNYWEKNVAPLIAEDSGEQTWRRIKRACYGWDDADQSPKTFYQQYRAFVKPESQQEFMRFHYRMAQLMEARNYTGDRAVFTLDNGGNVNEYIVIYGFNQHGGEGSGTFELSEGESVQDAYNKMFGWGSWDTDRKANQAAVELFGVLGQKMKFRSELSTQL